MEQLNNVDVIFLIIAGISALVGIARGMTKEILSICGWVLAAAALFYLVPLTTPYMEQCVISKWLANIVAGMVILLVFCIVWILTVDKLASLIRSSKLSALDRIFGFVFGLARGALIVILIALLISTLMPEDSKKGVFEKSVLFKQANAAVEPLKEMIPQSWVEAFKAQSERFGLSKKSEVEITEDAKDAESVEDRVKLKEKETEEAKDKIQKTKDEADDVDSQAEDEAKSPEETPTETQGLKETLKAISNNREVLKKSGEVLFNQLAQPKTSENADGGNSMDLDDLVSDLDKLLDVLDEKVVETDTTAPKSK
ncbi:MAG: CvpA family protein [Alphaproteobacteria bacterium]|nr:CvpA family protein [Alphaproteobacteria bacterium]